jgi:hypothetical protein
MGFVVGFNPVNRCPNTADVIVDIICENAVLIICAYPYLVSDQVPVRGFYAETEGGLVSALAIFPGKAYRAFAISVGSFLEAETYRHSSLLYAANITRIYGLCTFLRTPIKRREMAFCAIARPFCHFSKKLFV